MRSFFRKLQWLTRRSKKEAELQDELQFPLQEEAGERQGQGLTSEEVLDLDMVGTTPPGHPLRLTARPRACVGLYCRRSARSGSGLRPYKRLGAIGKTTRPVNPADRRVLGVASSCWSVDGCCNLCLNVSPRMATSHAVL